METKKLLLILAAGLLAIPLIYGIFIGSSALLASYYASDAMENQEDIDDSIEDITSNIELEIRAITVQGNEYDLNLVNTGSESVETDNLELRADGSDVTADSVFEDSTISSGEGSSVTVTLDSAEDTEFELLYNEQTIETYFCDYTEGALTC